MTALQGLQARLRLARLYLCTDTRRQQGDLADFLAEVLAGGVDVVQIWEPGLADEAVAEALEVARAAAAPHQAVVGVSGSATLAAATGADLLHLDPDGVPTSTARRSLDRETLVGRSALTESQIVAAVRDEHLDYFSFGPVFASPTKPDVPPAGLGLVRWATEAAPVYAPASKPWFAVGGITPDNLDQLLAAGARRVVVVSALTRADHPRDVAGRLSHSLAEAWRADPESERYTIRAAASTGR